MVTCHSIGVQPSLFKWKNFHERATLKQRMHIQVLYVALQTFMGSTVFHEHGSSTDV
jgi:hypothetical protein